MIPPMYNSQGKRKKGSTYNLNNIADFYKKEISCFYCNGTENLERDHVRPIFFGGNDKLKNLQILCNRCHRQKTEEEKDPIMRQFYIIGHDETFFNIPKNGDYF